LFETIDESFHDIPLSVVLVVERASMMFIAAPRDGTTDMVAMEILSKHSTDVAFICNQALWTEANVSGASTNRTCLHQFFCLLNVTFLTGCEQKGDQSARTFTTDVDFCAKTTTTAT
jgi:hypothetical protein